MGLTVLFLVVLFIAYMIKKNGFWGGIGALIKWGPFGFLTIATCGLFLTSFFLGGAGASRPQRARAEPANADAGVNRGY
ncbi:hypothetical protein [Phaeospirillum tilakii]|uniref:Uncharacterized protein n=1 Tax=Phaeospirillum tilakii TaxID=741673 RepID=A0ABW5CGU3_9PROT